MESGPCHWTKTVDAVSYCNRYSAIPVLQTDTLSEKSGRQPICVRIMIMIIISWCQIVADACSIKILLVAQMSMCAILFMGSFLLSSSLRNMPTSFADVMTKFWGSVKYKTFFQFQWRKPVLWRLQLQCAVGYHHREWYICITRCGVATYRQCGARVHSMAGCCIHGSLLCSCACRTGSCNAPSWWQCLLLKGLPLEFLLLLIPCNSGI